MARIHRPDRGSRAFSPRKRAKSQIPKLRSHIITRENPCLQEFAGYKAGMTHIIMIDDLKNSSTYGLEISVPVTIIEVPDIQVIGIRLYSNNNKTGEKPITEIWEYKKDKYLNKKIKIPSKSNDDIQKKIEYYINKNIISNIKIIIQTNPKYISSIPKKIPDIMEMSINGLNIIEKYNYAKSLLGKNIKFNDVFKIGSLIDTISITKGKGTQGPVKRWGISLMKGKHSRQGSLRQIGNLGPRGVSRVFWLTPQMGQTGYHQRTEFNKRILKFGTDGSEVTPLGGIINYGLISGNYILVKGSIPGPSKRLIRMRSAIRNNNGVLLEEPKILYISTKSQQG